MSGSDLAPFVGAVFRDKIKNEWERDWTNGRHYTMHACMPSLRFGWAIREHPTLHYCYRTSIFRTTVHTSSASILTFVFVKSSQQLLLLYIPWTRIEIIWDGLNWSCGNKRAWLEDGNKHYDDDNNNDDNNCNCNCNCNCNYNQQRKRNGQTPKLSGSCVILQTRALYSTCEILLQHKVNAQVNQSLTVCSWWFLVIWYDDNDWCWCNGWRLRRYK